MVSKLHKTRKLRRRVLKAAALGSVKLLKGLLNSHCEYIVKHYRKRARRASKSHRRHEDEHSSFNSSTRQCKKRFYGRGRGARVRGEKRRRKEAKEESNSESGSTDAIAAEASNSEESLTGSSASDIEEKTGRESSPSMDEIVNARDSQGLTPLHHACYAGSEKAVKYLISKGACVHSRDVRGNAPLHIASKMGLASLISLLQKAGAHIEVFNDDGETPSDILAKREEARKAKSDYVEQQSWYSHLADEVSDGEWWGESFSEAADLHEWESILQTMAENSQAKGLYHDDFSSLRFHLEQGKNQRKEKKPSKHEAKAAHMEGKTSYPEEVNLQKNTILVDTHSYNHRWKIFSKSYNLCLSYVDVPFPVPEGREEALAQVLLQGVDPSLHRDVLRKEILKWHPDKFLQKWDPKLQGPDHERIVARVNEISQALNRLYKDLASSK